jgi:predicted dehydrogenase
MSEPVKIGVVGVGYLGSIHAQIYTRLSDVTLVGVNDVNSDVGKRVAVDCGCDFYSDVDQLADSVDAVSVVVPTSCHREVSLPFLHRGIPVLLEKPVAHTLDDARLIVNEAEQSGAILQIGHLERFNAGVVRLHEELDRPRFIEVHRLSEFVERATDVDVVTDLMIHDIDIVLSLVRSELKYVSAVGASIVTNHVDIANARLEFEDGAIANVTASRVSAKRFRRIRVFADACYLALNFEDQQIEISRPGKRPPDGRFAPIINSSIQVEATPPLDSELAHFVDCVRKGKQPLVTGSDGLQALKVAYDVREKIEKSLHSFV